MAKVNWPVGSESSSDRNRVSRGRVGQDFDSLEVVAWAILEGDCEAAVAATIPELERLASLHVVGAFEELGRVASLGMSSGDEGRQGDKGVLHVGSLEVFFVSAKP